MRLRNRFQAAGLRLGLALALGMAPQAVARAEAPAAVSTAVPADGGTASYVLGYGDALDVLVLGNEGLTLRGAPIRPDGRVSVPLLGEVPAGGLSVGEFSEALRKGYARFVVRPQVVVNVARFRPVEVTVLGAVLKPGAYQASRPIPVLKALALAGGVEAERADVTHVRVIAADGTSRLVDLTPLLVGRDGENPILQDGDTVSVPESAQAGFYRLLPIIPSVMAFLTTVAVVAWRK